MPISGSQALIHFGEAGYRLFPVEAENAVAIETLPSHHQDPFDRILVAQALMEPMRVVTHDASVYFSGKNLTLARVCHFLFTKKEWPVT